MVSLALKKLWNILPFGKTGFAATLETELPPSAGLGSSAAFSVALVRCALSLQKFEATNLDVRAFAHELEKVFHGVPSGLDDTVATFGGTCLFKHSGFDLPQNSGFIADGFAVTKQAIAFPFHPPPLLVGLTGVKRNTKNMVSKVRDQFQQDRQRVENLFGKVDKCLEKGLWAIRSGKVKELGGAMLKNQYYLKKLGLTCPEIDTLVELAIENGACGAKLTGAGGGGAVVAVCQDSGNKVLSAWESAGFQAWKVYPNPKKVKLKCKPQQQEAGQTSLW